MKIFLTSLIGMSSLIAQEDPKCCAPGSVEAPNQISKPYQHQYGYPPSARTCVAHLCEPDAWGLESNLAFLVWQAKEEGLNYTFQNRPLTSFQNTLNNINGQFKGMDFPWRPAAQVAVCLTSPNRSWSPSLRWTTLYSSTSSSISSDANTTGVGLFPIWILPNQQFAVNNPILFESAGAVWKLHLNTFDLEFGYNALLTEHLSLQLFGGLKGALIKQSYGARYMDGVSFPDSGFEFSPPSTSYQPISALAKLTNNAYGVGPKVGFFSQWTLAKGWSLLGKIAGALPYYHMILKREDIDTTLFPNSDLMEVIRNRYQTSVWSYRPSLETSTGLGWDTCLGRKNTSYLGISLLYDIQYFFKQNIMSLLVGEPMTYIPFQEEGDLSLHGVTLNFKLGY